MKRPPEMSRKAFHAALARNGFARPVLMWCQDTSGRTSGVSYGLILHRNGKIARRASLAALLRKREQQETRKT